MIAAFSITPLGVGESVGELVAEAVGIVRASGLANETNAMFTNVEGSWDEVMGVIKACVDKAHAMGLRLVAEGVEDVEIAAALTQVGVDLLQGYHIARPMPSRDVAGWVRNWTQSQQLGLHDLTLG